MNDCNCDYSCECECHKHHLSECGQCLYACNNAMYDKYTDSAIVDRVARYFHRYSEPGKLLGTTYYEYFLDCITSNKEIILHSKKLKYIDYLFTRLHKKKTLRLIHYGIISFLAKNGKGLMAQDADSEGKLKWRIVHED